MTKNQKQNDIFSAVETQYPEKMRVLKLIWQQSQGEKKLMLSKKTSNSAE